MACDRVFNRGCGAVVQQELEARGKLHGAQHTQAVVAKRLRVDGAEHASAEITAAIERIFVLAGQWVPRDGVDGEVPPPRRFLDRHRGISLDLEALVSAAALRFAPGQCDVDSRAVVVCPDDLVDREALTDRLDPDPAKPFRATLEAIRYLEDAVTTADGLEGVVLRYGGLYGPGTSIDADGAHLDAIRQRKFPVVGDGEGVWSFVHVEDAATATVAAIEGDATGIFNVVDDEPARVADWLPVLADAVGAPPPRHVPIWLGRVAAGATRETS